MRGQERIDSWIVDSCVRGRVSFTHDGHSQKYLFTVSQGISSSCTIFFPPEKLTITSWCTSISTVSSIRASICTYFCKHCVTNRKAAVTGATVSEETWN